MTALSRSRVAFTLGSVVLAAVLAAQQEVGDPAETEPYFEAIDVEVINIDVWVTGKNREPIEGLGREDFVVLRDGEAVEITNFYAVANGRPVAGASAGEEPSGSPIEAEPERQPPLAALPVGDFAPEHQLWLIVFFDNYNLDPVERNRILPDVYRFLGRALEAGGRVLIASYDRGLEVRQPFTDQLPLLTDALAAIKDDSGLATIRRRDQMAALERIDESDDAARALLYARQYAEEQMSSVGFTVAALEKFIETLAGLPGRKAVVHVSSGISMLAGEEMFHAVADKFDVSEPYGEIPRHDMTRAFERLGRIANAHRVAFHTVDAGGLRGMQFGAAEYAGFVDPSFRRTLDSIVPENLQSPLRFMAGETGGRVIVNRNEIFPALEEVRSDFSSFYSLGITSQDPEGGRYHRIEVKLRDGPSGARIRHRAGYRSKSRQTRVREELRSALLYAHERNPLLIDVRWGVAEPQGERERYLLPIQVGVPLRQLAVLPTADGIHEVRLQLFVGAAGRDGALSEIDVAPLGVRLADEHVEAARLESFLHGHKLLLGKGRQKVAVALLDVFSGESSVVTGIIQVGPAEAESEEETGGS